MVEHPAIRSAIAYFRAGDIRTRERLDSLVEHWAVVLGFLGRESTLDLHELQESAWRLAVGRYLVPGSPAPGEED